MGSREEIMDATCTALARHGYAETSIQDIADETGKSKSLIYHHFEDKEDLMLSFLEYLTEEIKQEYLVQDDSKTPEEQINEVIDAAIGIDGEKEWELRKSLFELRSTAAENLEFQEKFRKIDDMVKHRIQEIIQQTGAEQPENRAEIITSVLEGAASRKITTGDRKGLEKLKKSIEKMVECKIFEE
ncbi:MAG: TetR/AcrR family transcriptional regulator [Candidatus Nanohalobium sp.]